MNAGVTGFKSSLKQVWFLGLPLCLTYVFQTLIIMIDSVFAGNINHTNLAAISLGGNSFYLFHFLVVGVCVASSIKAGQAFGANNNSAVINSIRQGALLCCLTAVPSAILLVNFSWVMAKLGQDPIVIELSCAYLSWFAWTLPIQALIVLFRSYFAVIEQPWRGVLPMVLTLVLNVFLDYCLSTGQLGFPNMGIAGIGLASLISNLFLLFMMLWNINSPKAGEFFHFTHPDVWANRGFLALFLISIPISITLVAEEAFFVGSTYLAGTLGVAQLASHQILLNTIGTSYTFNTGIAIACSILIGRCIGANQINKITQFVGAGFLSMLLFTLPFAIALLLFTDEWISLFLDMSLLSNHDTMYFVRQTMLITVVMLFVDILWLLMIESLHGILDVSFSAWSTIGAYWLIGGPLALWTTSHLIFPLGWIWNSMLIATCVLTLLIWFRFFYRLRRMKQGN